MDRLIRLPFQVVYICNIFMHAPENRRNVLYSLGKQEISNNILLKGYGKYHIHLSSSNLVSNYSFLFPYFPAVWLCWVFFEGRCS